MTVQNANAQDNRPTFQNVDRLKAPAEGQAGAPLITAGWDMSVGVLS